MATPPVTLKTAWMTQADGSANSFVSVIGPPGPMGPSTEAAAQFAAQAGASALAAAGSATAAAASEAGVAADAATASSAAAVAEAIVGPTYASTAAGLAATTSGQSFAVNNSGIVTIYLNAGGTAVAQRDIVTAQALSSTIPGKGASLVSLENGQTVQDVLDGSAPSSAATAADIIPVARGGANYAVTVKSVADIVRTSDTVSGNLIMGSPSSGSLLNNTPAGTKNGDISTAFGINTLSVATSAYALSAFGYGALCKVTSGHSNTGLGYQAGHNLTTGERNTLVGVDAMFLATSASFNTVVGHHCMNVGVYTGSGAVVIGQQTARNLTGGDNIVTIGRNAMANCPATGSQNAVVIGGAAAIASAVDGSVILGHQAVTAAGTITTSVIIGRNGQYGGGTVSNTVQIGADSMFRASGGGGDNNATLGYQTGFNIAGTGNVLVGYRAGYLSSATTVNSAVCIGNLAGFGMVTSGDLYIGNGSVLAAHLIWGNFGTQTLNLRSSNLKLVNLPTYADDAAAGAAGLTANTVYKTATGELRIKT